MYAIRSYYELGKRRLFQGFQQGIEGIDRQHVNFVDNEDFESGAGRQIADVVPQLPHIIDAGIGSAVDFEHIDILSYNFV